MNRNTAMSFIEYCENVLEIGTTFCFSVMDELSNIVPTFWLAMEYLKTTGHSLISSTVPTLWMVMDCMTYTGRMLCSKVIPTYWLVHDHLKTTGLILQNMLHGLINTQWRDLTRERNIRLFSQNDYNIDEMNPEYSRFHCVNNYSSENLLFKCHTPRASFQSESPTSLQPQVDGSITNRRMFSNNQNPFAPLCHNQYNNNTQGLSFKNRRNLAVTKTNVKTNGDRGCPFQESNTRTTTSEEYHCPAILRQYPNVVRALRINVRRRLGLNYLADSGLKDIEDAVLNCNGLDDKINKTAVNQNSQVSSPFTRTSMWNKENAGGKSSKSDVLFRGIFSTASLKTETSTSFASDLSTNVGKCKTDRPKTENMTLLHLNTSLDEHISGDLFSKPKFMPTKRSRMDNFGSTEKTPSISQSFIGKRPIPIRTEDVSNHYRNDDISAKNIQDHVTKTRRPSKRPNSTNRLPDQKGVISKSALNMDQWLNEPFSGGDELAKIPSRWNSNKPWVAGENVSPTSQYANKQAMSACSRPELDIPNEVRSKISKVDATLRSSKVMAESILNVSKDRKLHPKNRHRSKSRNRRGKSVIKRQKINKQVSNMTTQQHKITDTTFESQLLRSMQTAQRFIDDEALATKASEKNENRINETVSTCNKKAEDCSSDLYSNTNIVGLSDATDSGLGTLVTVPKINVQSETVHSTLSLNSDSQASSTSSLLEIKHGKSTLSKPKISKMQLPKSKTPQLLQSQSKTLQHQSHKAKTPQLLSTKSNTPQLEASKSRLQQLQQLQQQTPKTTQLQQSKPKTPHLQASNPKTPQLKSSKPKTPQLQGSKPKTPQLQGSKPKTPQIQGSKPKTPQLQGSKPTTPQLQGSKPKTPKSKSSLLQLTKPKTPQPRTPTPKTPTPQQQQPKPPNSKTPKAKPTMSSVSIMQGKNILPTHVVKEKMQGQMRNVEQDPAADRIVDTKPVLAKEKFSFAYTNIGQPDSKPYTETNTPSVSDTDTLQDIPTLSHSNKPEEDNTSLTSKEKEFSNLPKEDIAQQSSNPLLEKESFRVSVNTTQQQESTSMLPTGKLCISNNHTVHQNSDLACYPNKISNQDDQLPIGSDNGILQQDNKRAIEHIGVIKSVGAIGATNSPCFGSRPTFTQVFGSVPVPLVPSKNLPSWTNAVDSDRKDKQTNPFMVPTSTESFGSETLVGLKSFEQFSAVSENSSEHNFSFQGDNFCKYR